MEEVEGEAIYAEIGSPNPRLFAHPQQTSVTMSAPNQQRPLPQAPASDQGQGDNTPIPIQETMPGKLSMRLNAIEVYSGFYVNYLEIEGINWYFIGKANC